MGMLTFEYRGQPKSWLRPANKVIGQMVRSFTPARQMKYQRDVALSFLSQKPKEFVIIDDLPIKMFCRFFLQPRNPQMIEKCAGGVYPHTGKIDVDNMLKNIADALNGVAYRDDCLIYHMVGEKYWAAQPSVQVRLEW